MTKKENFLLLSESRVKVATFFEGITKQIVQYGTSLCFLEYAASDVAVMFNLTRHLTGPVGTESRMLRESAKRVASVKSPRYVTHGRSKAEAPTSW